MQLNAGSLPRIGSYEAALAEFQKRPDYTDRMRSEKRIYGCSKPLSPYKHKTHLTIRQEHGGDIALRYHYTDVVTYHRNGDFTVEGFSSQSTNTFLAMTTPNGVRVNCTDAQLGFTVMLDNSSCNRNEYWAPEAQVYRFSHHLRLTQDSSNFWVPDRATPTQPFDVPSFDRKLASQSLKGYRFYEFRD